MKTNKTHLQRMVGTALLAAIVVVLQFFVLIPLGPFYITLTLVPIIVGAIMFGPSAGAFLGAVFGIAVSIQVVTGAAGVPSYMMFEHNPVITILICLLKGTVAGWVSGFLSKLFTQKGMHKTAVILSAVACPICNTGIFAIGVLVFFNSLAATWAMENAFANAFTYVLLGMIGLNFLVEFAINVLMIPVVVRIVSIVRSKF